MCALRHQLHALGILATTESREIPFDCDACRLLEELYVVAHLVTLRRRCGCQADTSRMGWFPSARLPATRITAT